MKFVIFASLIASALAVPAELTPRTGSVCQSFLYSTAACCATSVLDVANLDCQTPNDTPRNPTHFKEICATKGQQARCCLLLAAGQGFLCTRPVGVQ